ncbi:hypothetical protein TSOC_010828, partial [Tetrabaena socialis]
DPSSLSRYEFKSAVLAATGRKLSSADLQHVLGGPVPSDTRLTAEQLMRVIQAVLAARAPEAHLRAVYQAFDVHAELDVSHTGRVSCEVFMAALKGRLA